MTRRFVPLAPTNVVPGQSVGLTVPMQPVGTTPSPCPPDATCPECPECPEVPAPYARWVLGIRPYPDNEYTEASYSPDPRYDSSIITAIDATAHDSDGMLPQWAVIACVENLPYGATLTWAASASGCTDPTVTLTEIAPNHVMVFWGVPEHDLGVIRVIPSIDGVAIAPITMNVYWYMGS